ncbi:hypothetical protein F5Y18DRAFT_442302 [Xylariaceae sp. FL1019]|nr:hypothetical protein F5Y18DRAFT_442302 [Xylariaceae sp. FL1019]
MTLQKSAAATVGRDASERPSGKHVSAKRRPADEAPSVDAAQKRRRRAFSCLSCQKLKCRCQYDPGAVGCHRCQTLRSDSLLVRWTGCCTAKDCQSRYSRIHCRRKWNNNDDARLQRHEEALGEIKSMLSSLKEDALGCNRTSRTQSWPDKQRAAEATSASGECEGEGDGPIHEYFASPVDKGTISAPVAVLREISQRATLGYRRALSECAFDFVQLQLLDEQTAADLIELFIKHQGHNLFACPIDNLRGSGETRRVSSSLHTVCCFMGIVYRPDLVGTPLHRHIYEQVRITLGQAVLASPLEMEDINAMFIMSNNANTPNSSGSEYIDSWLLTGYCAKQAMLSISFSKIVNNIKKGISTIEDHRTMHLWSTICLHHLQWAATTGRPSVIPKMYLNQCQILLSFYQATMKDQMLVAEILLYSILHEKLSRQSYPQDGCECEEFLAWKQRWNHLLALPTSSMLKIGYNAACLIIVVRMLEDTGHALGSTSLLSTETSPAVQSTPIAYDTTSPSSYRDSGSRLDKDDASTTEVSSNSIDHSTGDILRANGCKYAKQVLETFLDMPRFLMDGVSTPTNLCIGYCTILVAHYDSSQSKIPDTVALELVRGIDNWVRTSPGKSWAYKYGSLALRKIEARVGRATENPEGSAQSTHDAGKGTAQASPNLASEPPSENLPSFSTDDLFTPQSFHHDGSLSFDVNEQDLFPSMEDFFGGRFFDFMR